MTAGADSRRARNRARVVAALREAGAASRAELARRTGLSRTTVASVVAELEHDGVLVEHAHNAAASPRGGPPPRLLSFSRSAGAAIGIDFGKRHLRVAASDLSHGILAETERPMLTEEPAEWGRAGGGELGGGVLRGAGLSGGEVVGVGPGPPGPIDRRSGRV